MPPQNFKSDIFTRGFATRDKIAFSVHSVKENRSYTKKVKFPLYD